MLPVGSRTGTPMGRYKQTHNMKDDDDGVEDYKKTYKHFYFFDIFFIYFLLPLYVNYYHECSQIPLEIFVLKNKIRFDVDCRVACSCFVRGLFTLYSWLVVHNLFVTCSWLVHDLFTGGS